jgi:hypothetical protein
MDGDRLSGVLLFAVGLYLAYEALKLPFGTVRQPDAGFFPLCIAVSLAFLSGFIFLGTFMSEHVGEPLRFREGMPSVLITVLALILYIFVLNLLGYLISTLAIMILLLKGVERLGWQRSLWVAVPTVTVSYFIFRWLGVPLPRGIIPL